MQLWESFYEYVANLDSTILVAIIVMINNNNNQSCRHEQPTNLGKTRETTAGAFHLARSKQASKQASKQDSRMR